MEKWAVFGAGLAQFGMVVVGLRVPRALGWKEDLAKLRPMNRRLFWVYGAFIAGTNAGFGAISMAFPGEIAAGRGLAGAFALLVGLYWAARLAVQAFVFDAADGPAGAEGWLARYGLGLVILLLSAVYLAAFARGLAP